ncbi:hypothetical protein HDV63DRAFT_169285 [Trichoderma sp. SZMC 28014]
MSEHPSKMTGRRPSMTKPVPPPAPRKAQATGKKSQAGTHKPHASGNRAQIISIQKPQAASSMTEVEAPLEASQALAGNKPEATSTDSLAVDIASLTLDTPIIELRKKPPRVPATPFHFLSLPSELRVKIYEYYFDENEDVLDLSPENYKRYHKRLGLMRVCKLLRDEATYFFYGTRTFRIFPTYPGKYFKSKKPILARLKPRQRECITSLELRLGPGWNAPPKGWAVNDALGLKDCINVHKLKVLVECDPSDNIFKGFRRSEGFYEKFSRQLLASVLEELPAVDAVEFDAWSSVKKSGAMMTGLFKVVTEREGLSIQWGPDRGWTDAEEEEPVVTGGPDPNRPIESVPIQGFGNAHNIGLMVVA